MRKILAVLTVFSALIFASTANATETYQIDPSHTYIQWHINHLGFSEQTGKWMPTGTIVIDEANPKNSKVDISVDVAGMVTGVDKLNEHLKGESFFDVAKYPVATFVSDKVTVTGKNTAKVHGILTVRGVAKPITLDVTLNKKGVSVVSDKMTMGFKANTKLKRSDFGMTAFLPALGDDVKIDIQAEAIKQ